jgi:hypothetical protein
MSFSNKRVEDSIKQAKLLAQMSEMSYRSLNGARQTRNSFINNDLKEQPLTDKPAVGSLTSEMIAQYIREEEEQNRYVDPKSNKEFQYAPAGTAPILSTPTLVSVTSLGRNGWMAGWVGWVGGWRDGWAVCEVKTKGFIKPLALGWIGGRV